MEKRENKIVKKVSNFPELLPSNKSNNTICLPCLLAGDDAENGELGHASGHAQQTAQEAGTLFSMRGKSCSNKCIDRGF